MVGTVLTPAMNTCALCEKSFQPSGNRYRYCSPECQRLGHVALKRKKYVPKPREKKPPKPVAPKKKATPKKRATTAPVIRTKEPKQVYSGKVPKYFTDDGGPWDFHVWLKRMEE